MKPCYILGVHTPHRVDYICKGIPGTLAPVENCSYFLLQQTHGTVPFRQINALVDVSAAANDVW